MPGNMSVGNQPAPYSVDTHVAHEASTPAKTGLISRFVAFISRCYCRLFNIASPKESAEQGAVAAAREFPVPAMTLGNRSAQAQPLPPHAALAHSAMALKDALDVSVTHAVDMMAVRANKEAEIPAGAEIPPPENLPALNDDVMGIIGGFLKTTDKLNFRELNPSIKAAVDRTITRLEMTAPEAAKRLRERGAFPKLTELKITHWNNESLRALAETLKELPRGSVDLVLGAIDRDSILDLSSLSKLNLSSLTMNCPSISAHWSPGLKQAVFPIHLTDVDCIPDDAISLRDLPRLRTIEISAETSTAEKIGNAIAEHPSLKEVTGRGFTPEAFLAVLQNPRIEVFNLKKLYGNDAIGRSALSNHRGLKALGGPVLIDDARSLLALARNKNITTLDLYLTARTASDLHSLAEMPALSKLTLNHTNDVNKFEYAAADLRAICAKPMASLEFRNASMRDVEALADALSANAKHLAIIGTTIVQNQWAMGNLIRNKNVSSLVLTTDVEDVQLLALVASPTLEKLDISFFSNKLNAQDVQSAWVNAGKLLANLKCNHRA